MGAQVVECQQRLNGFELLFHRELGFRIGYRNSNGIMIRLQQNQMFSNSNAMIPLYSNKEYFYIGQWNFYRVYQYEWSLNFNNEEHVILPLVHSAWCVILILLNFKLMYKAREMDISGMNSGSYCT